MNKKFSDRFRSHSSNIHSQQTAGNNGANYNLSANVGVDEAKARCSAMADSPQKTSSTDEINGIDNAQYARHFNEERAIDNNMTLFDNLSQQESIQLLSEQRIEIERLSAEAEKLAAERTKQSNELKAMGETLLRERADAINTANRLRKQIDEAGKFAISNLVKDMTEVLENLYRAQQAYDSARELIDSKSHAGQLSGGIELINIFKSAFEGLTLTLQSMTNTLTKYGVRRLWPLGETFDHNFQEVISCVPDLEKTNGTVINVIKAGYAINDRVLTPALVVIVQNGDSSNNNNDRDNANNN